MRRTAALAALGVALLPSFTSALLVGAPARPTAPARARPTIACEPVTVEHFIGDLEYLGPCRFVVMGPGAILEAVGAFEDLRRNDKGLATVSTDTGFECHIKLAEVKRAAFATKESGDKTLHIIRLLGGEGQPLLSAILSPDNPGEEVEESAIVYWSKLRDRFGADVELVQS